MNGKYDGFLRAGIDILVLRKAGVEASLPTQDAGEGEHWSPVNQGVVIQPHILA